MVDQVVTERDALALAKSPFIVKLFYSFQVLYIVLLTPTSLHLELVTSLNCYFFREKFGTIVKEIVAHLGAEVNLGGIVSFLYVLRLCDNS